MFDTMVQWCSICNSRPADGMLLVQLEGIEEPENLPACEPCVNDPDKVEFI